MNSVDIISGTCLVGFFLLIFVIGQFKKNYTDTIHVFSIGGRDFSTAAITITLIATWVSASGFNIDLTRFYDQGWKFLFPSFGMIISILFITIVVIPRAAKILGKTSVASFMGEYYGEKVRVISAIVGVFSLCGCITIQFKLLGTITYYLWPILPKEIFTLIFGGLTVYYCYLGGIRSVIYTDIGQAVLFSISFIAGIILLQTLPIAENINDYDLSKFKVTSIFNSSKDELLEMSTLLFYFTIPALNPAEFQRISLGVNIKQIKLSWFLSCIGFLSVISAGCYISYQIFLINPSLLPDERLPFFLNQFIYLKPVMIIGILAMGMSTADSCINISAVMLANDTFKRNVWDPYEKFEIARRYTFLIGLIAYFLTFWDKDLLEIIMFTTGFYMPLITIPLMIAIFDYKITERCVLISMGVTTAFWCGWHILYESEPLVFAMSLNAILLASTHYIIEKWELLKCFGIKSQIKKT